MSEISFNVHAINGDGSVQLGTENDVLALFYKDKEVDPIASREKGIMVYRDVDMVRIQQPGERDVTVQKVTDKHKQRWPQRWALYQQNRSQDLNGTPLEILFPASPATVATLQALGIRSVQQLAEISDGAAANIQFGHELREKAKHLLGTVEKGKDYHALEKKLEDQIAVNRALEERLKALEASSEEKRGPGRPRKTDENQEAA